MNTQELTEIKAQLDLAACADWRTIPEAEANARRFAALLERLAAFIARTAQESPCDKNINSAIVLLAENSGCGIDIKNHENFMAELRRAGLITGRQERLFYKNENRRQG